MPRQYDRSNIQIISRILLIEASSRVWGPLWTLKGKTIIASYSQNIVNCTLKNAFLESVRFFKKKCELVYISIGLQFYQNCLFKQCFIKESNFSFNGQVLLLLLSSLRSCVYNAFNRNVCYRTPFRIFWYQNQHRQHKLGTIKLQ